MPQFEVGQSKTARVRMKNPTGKAFDYTGSILFSLSPVSEKSFSLGAGEEKDILFPVTIPDMVGTHPVHVGVFSEGKSVALYQATEDVVISPPSLTLGFTNPKAGAVLWDAVIWDINTRTKITGTPAGGKELHIPCTLYPSGNTFLLYVMELPPSPLPGPYWYGPYLVTIPRFGEYIWNSFQGRIDSIQGIDMPNTGNESKVVGIVTGFSWLAAATWAVYMTIQETTGAQDFVKYFDSIYAKFAIMPLDSLARPVIPTGSKVTCNVGMLRDTYDAAWKAWNFRAYHTYPPEAFNFSGSVTVGGVIRKQYEADPGNWVWADFRQINWSVSGGIPPFSVRVVKYGIYGNVTGFHYSGSGPASGTYEVLEDAFQLGYEGKIKIFAHPNPSPSEWDQYSWEYNNWKQVASN